MGVLGMSLILQIETATANCSVALSENGQTIGIKEKYASNIHASHITLFIEEVMQTAGKNLKQLDAIAVSKGPGSYTGLRIGVSTAKGLCFALEKPLIAIETLDAMCQGVDLEAIYLCPMLDARRMEVYSAVYNHKREKIIETGANIITEEYLNELLIKEKVVFFGSGAEKCKEIIKSDNAIFLDDFYNSAAHFSELAKAKFDKNAFENVAYFEPYYLKEFMGTTPKKNLF